MSRELCPICMGEQVLSGSADGEYVLAACWACHGRGFKSALLIRKTDPRVLKRANRMAVETIIRELERRRA